MAASNDVEKFEQFYQSEFGKRILAKEVEYLRRELKGLKNILDVGCGIGYFEKMLAELNITGLDSMIEALEKAKKISDKNFVLGNATRLDFPDASFDGVFSVTTLEFLDNYEKAVDEIVRVLKPGGKLVAMILNPESDYFKTRAQNKNSYFARIKHLDPKDIENYISRLLSTRGEYFLGIKGQEIFETCDKKLAALYVIVGTKI